MNPKCSNPQFLFITATLILLLAVPLTGMAADVVGGASVQEDATIRVKGRRVHLFGIYIPALRRTCGNHVRPLSCERESAARALSFKINRFVHCNEQWKNRDGSIAAVCVTDGEDLSAYLIKNGWALATPAAPFEYHALERLARHRGLGVWGSASFLY